MQYNCRDTPWSPKAALMRAIKKSSVSEQTQRTAMPWYHLGSRRWAPPHTRCNRRTWGGLPAEGFRFRGPARKGISHTALYPLSPSVGSLERGWRATSLGHSHFHQLSCIIGAHRPLVKPFLVFSAESRSWLALFSVASLMWTPAVSLASSRIRPARSRSSTRVKVRPSMLCFSM